MALTCTRYPMPDYILTVLTERGLLDAYRARPDYQQNDYICWVSCAKREDMREKCLSYTWPGVGAGECWKN